MGALPQGRVGRWRTSHHEVSGLPDLGEVVRIERDAAPLIVYVAQRAHRHANA